MFPQFNNPENDFWKEYEKIDHELLGIPKDIYNEYKEIFDKNTWYDLLGYKNLYYNYNNFCDFCIKNNIKNKQDYKNIYNNNNYPKFPKEYYRLTGWNGWNNIKKNNIFDL